MAVQPGTRIGAYEILSPLGTGGMGEVFTARDTRLHRQVAIKFLTPEVASDPQHRERFEREARAVAALNHPNIVTLHSVEEVEGRLFLVMERVNGRTLQEVIPTGGLPIAEFLPTAISITDAVAAAHRQGITHRDLKPANVMITADGIVKVLDFGLAKVHGLEHGDLSTRADLTEGYQVIGTISYMSPEQAEGKAVDSRSDIFSLGVILHEMATGERPFRGDSSASIISSILRDDPQPVTELRSELPSGLNRIIRRCLAKDPSARYQSAVDLGHDLRELAATADSNPTREPARGRVSGPLKFLAFVAMLAVVTAVATWVRLRDRNAPVAFEAERFARLTSDGDVNLAAISPDGRNVVHVKYVNNRPGLWVRQVGTTTDVQIVEPGDVGYGALTYSPDGLHIYFTARGSVSRIPALGGSPRKLADKDVDSAVVLAPDGKRMAFVRTDDNTAQSHVFVTDLDWRNEQQVATIGLFVHGPAPSWSPDGTSLLVVTHAKDFSGQVVHRVNIADGSVDALTDALPSIGSAAWLPDGKSFLMSAADTVGSPAQIWQVLLPSSERRRITNDVNSYSELSVSSDGRIVAAVQEETITTLRRLTNTQESGSQLLSGRSDNGARGVAWSANGQILFTSSRSGKTELWAVQADGTRLRQLTENSGWSPAASSDGRWFVYVDGRMQLWRGSFDNTAPTLLTAASRVFHPMIDRDGRVHYDSIVNGQLKAFRLPHTGGAPEETSEHLFFPTDTLPNGDLLGAKWDEIQRSYVAAIKPAAGGSLRLLSHVLIQSPAAPSLRVTPDGALSFVQTEDGRREIWCQPIEKGPAVQLTHSEGDDIFAFAWSPDGKELVVSRGRTASDVVLIHRK